MLTYKVGNCNNWIKKNLICTSTLNTIVFSMDIFSNRISIILVFAWSNEQRKDISSWKEILFAKKLSFTLWNNLHLEESIYASVSPDTDAHFYTSVDKLQRQFQFSTFFSLLKRQTITVMNGKWLKGTVEIVMRWMLSSLKFWMHQV